MARSRPQELSHHDRRRQRSPLYRHRLSHGSKIASGRPMFSGYATLTRRLCFLVLSSTLQIGRLNSVWSLVKVRHEGPSSQGYHVVAQYVIHLPRESSYALDKPDQDGSFRQHSTVLEVIIWRKFGLAVSAVQLSIRSVRPLRTSTALKSRLSLLCRQY
ncbi:hypothetical protein EDD17DRAFT_843201 [Pisolithus thermaeus]|nr:hypothetical protein EDD17DRAFT_843201 [Pisolithus thermaeus]